MDISGILLASIDARLLYARFKNNSQDKEFDNLQCN